ncbi:MAG TPA: hypothetical protein VH134_16730 [Candidatus Dormibacteraeota bacterium]|jgi:hypothetical protein|nr:hypothetical protein [Candidatus Dormibacteraeota bacterium]
MPMPEPVARELPALYVADPFAAPPVRCPWCQGEVVVDAVAAHGRGARRTVHCRGCGVRMSQETRPIPGRRVA